MKKYLLLIMVVLPTTFISNSLKAQQSEGSIYLSISAGQGFKKINLINNTIGFSLPNTGLFYRFSIQSNMQKNFYCAIDYLNYSTNKEANTYHLSYSDNYYTISLGKNITKRLGIQFGLGGNYSRLTINKKQSNTYNDSIFNHFQYLNNDFKSSLTLSLSTKIKYNFFNAFNQRMQGHLIFETLYKTKLEREFTKDNFSKCLFNLGFGISYKLFKE